VCFARGIEPGVTLDGLALLDAAMPDDAAAARLAHLLTHLHRGSQLAAPPDGADCARWLEGALDEEARAWALELRLLGDRGAALPFARAAGAAPAAERAAVIRRWLAEHPEGEGTVPPLGVGYAARCRASAERGASSGR
jgi:hypothetical protein